MLPLLTLLFSAASAAPRVGLSAGYEAVVNDPFVHRRGLRLGASFAAGDRVELALAGTWYPVLGDGGCDDPDWARLTCQLSGRAGVSPDVSKLTAQLQGTVRIFPFATDLGVWQTRAGILAGPGLVATADDLSALQAEGVEEAIATEKQVHPASVLGAVGELRGERLGVRLRVENITYIETIMSSTLETKSNTLLGVDGVVWF